VNTFKTLLQSTVAPIVGVVLGFIAMAALGYATHWGEGLGKLGPAWFWGGLLIFVVLGIVIGVLWVLPRYREKRFITALQAEDSATPEQEAEESRKQLRDKLVKVIKELENAPGLRKERMPLYALPWYLLIGSSQSGKTTLLHGVAATLSPFLRTSAALSDAKENGSKEDCNWWCFDSAVLIDTSGRYAFPKQVERDSAQWYRLLQLLRHYREHQPINGIVIAVSAAALVSQDEDALRTEARELRKRLHEVIEELGIAFPTYLLVTQCDVLEGFTEFFGCFPERTQRQAFGCINEQPPSTTPPFDTLFTSMVERLQQLRLSLLQEKPPTGTLRQRVFCFPEEFHALQQPLSTLVEVLFSANRIQHTPWWRGVFFCSAQQQGALLSCVRRALHFEPQSQCVERGTKPYFLHDLFADILHRERGLVQRTSKQMRGTRRRGVLGFAGCMVLCLLVALLLLRASTRDRRLAATDTRACEMAGEQGAAESLLDQAEQCRQVVQKLVESNHQRAAWSTLLFNRSGTLAETSRQQYEEKFAREVLAPLDIGVTQRLVAGADAPSVAALLLDRLDLLRQCMTEVGCPQVLGKDGQPDYRLMMASSRLPPQEQVTQLQRTYEAYLRWSSGSKEALRQEQTAHIDHLQSWISSEPFASHLRAWVSQRYPPVTAHEYWDVPPAAEREKVPEVEGAYTRAGWEEGVLPFLDRLARAVPDTAPVLDKVRKEYEAQYVEQWRRFLVAFPRGQVAWMAPRERRLQLMSRLLEAHSPYNRILDIASTNLRPLSGETPAWGRVLQSYAGSDLRPLSGETPVWVRVLQSYVGSESRKLYRATLEQELGKQLVGSALRARSFALVQAGFKEGMPTTLPTHPILKAWWLIDELQRQESPEGPAAAAAFWPLLQEPVRFVWKVMLEEASLAIQESWNDLLLAVKDLPPNQKYEFLYGKEDKAAAFVKDQVAVFLQRSGEEYTQKKLLDGALAFTDQFLLYLKQARIGYPIAISGATKRRVEISGDPAAITANGLKVAKTELILSCDQDTGGRQSLETSDAGKGATFTWAVNSCDGPWLYVYLVDASGQLLTPLEKRYQDLAQFLGYFSGPQRSLPFLDFKVGNQAQFAPYGLKTITLHYRCDDPEKRQQVQRDVDDYKRYAVDVQKRLELPAKIVAVSP